MTLQLPSRDALRERILPDHPNTRWLYSVIVQMCLRKGQHEGTLPQLKKIAGYGNDASIWPMLQHLQEVKLIVLECQYVSVANQPSRIRIALAGQQVMPFAEKRIAATSPQDAKRHCEECGGDFVKADYAVRVPMCKVCYAIVSKRDRTLKQVSA